MCAISHLKEYTLFSTTGKDEVEKNGIVHVVSEYKITRVKRWKKRAQVCSWWTLGPNNDRVVVVDQAGRDGEVFDELVLAVDVDAILNVLRKDAPWRRRRFLTLKEIPFGQRLKTE